MYVLYGPLSKERDGMKYREYRGRDAVRDSSRAGMFAFIAGVAVLVVALVLGAMFMFGFGVFQRETADFRGDVEATERTGGSGAFRITAYDHFYDLCAAIQGEEDRLESLRRELETNPSESRRNQLNATIAAVEAARDRKIREYNVDARKDYTLGEFRASDLPFELDPDQEETSCEI